MIRKQYRAKDGQLFRVSKNKSKDEECVALVIKDIKTRCYDRYLTDTRKGQLEITKLEIEIKRMYFLQLTGVEHRVASANHPQTHCLTEQFNQTLHRFKL